MALTEAQRLAREGKLLDRCIPEPNSGCWLWLGYVKNSGYGSLSLREEGRTVTKTAHRWAYLLFRGELKDSDVVRHSCDNKICVNPDHLLVGDQKQNISDCISRGRNFWLNRDRCKNGHIFTITNTRIRKEGGRRCIICARLATKRHYHAKRSSKVS